MSDRLGINILNLVQRKGEQLTLIHNVQGTYTPGTGQSAPTVTKVPITGKILNWNQTFVKGSVVVSTDRRVVIAAYGLQTVPAMKDQIQDSEGVIYNIIDVNPVKDGNCVAGYICRVAV